MEVKLQKKLTDFEYLVMFDLASKNTGICLWDIQHKIPILTYKISVTDTGIYKERDLYAAIGAFFDLLSERGFRKESLLVSKEAMPTQLRGGNSTVQTFVALAKAHAVLNLYLAQNEISAYDCVGVFPASTHAYLRKLRAWDASFKVTKDDIKRYVIEQYGVSSDLSFDEYDAIFLARTFVDIKINKDIEEAVRDIKRHKKTLKSAHAIAVCDEEIKRLGALKVEKEGE